METSSFDATGRGILRRFVLIVCKSFFWGRIVCKSFLGAEQISNRTPSFAKLGSVPTCGWSTSKDRSGKCVHGVGRSFSKQNYGGEQRQSEESTLADVNFLFVFPPEQLDAGVRGAGAKAV
eukprot:g44818.t1